MIRSLIILLATACLVGCFVPDMKHYSGSNYNKADAVMITDLKNADSMRVVKFDQNYNTKQRKQFKLSGVTKLYSLHLGSYRQTVFVTEPGVYFISGASYKVGNVQYVTALDGITPEGTIIYGAFEVKAGEVVYIGDLKFNWHKNSPKFIETSSQFTTVVRDLEASSKYRDLAPKLKPAKFYPSGSKISMDEKGNVTISNG